ncbi:MAG: DNA repair exonuclease [SAR202 cluster bacterium]|jgi:DNA repair exonuclease SbcCD nuclease subunit|nr:DNA repair exonuclease [SAR202 cluster bacterium]MDP6301938.1 DNA repair exonuclease [SAR202 cluster bacterium]MDP7103996.1 DNA repair exonuclease [SAR202 cluster bacterium]MDP7225553.1 DNA repair exonuclease [SAR202 cluster bacterium]MDP7413614.1 DNA repair exonuclease [SAR202 cluster bacterium]|tara:strand:- start:13143 stop:14411 length:1269 start_codon:yes stop_codon:yes gene_type:complete
MSLIRFVHTADLHLDSPFQGIAASVPSIAIRLRNATFDAYEKIIDLCIEENVDALLVAGDVFDGRDRSLQAQLRFVAGLQRLDEAGVRSFICHGNHDPLDGWDANLAFPPSATSFGSEVERIPVFPDDPDRVVVCGMSYPTRVVNDNLIPRFGTKGAERAAIGLVHANVGTDTGHEVYAPCTLGDLEATGFDYWALGHVHTRQVLRERDPAVVYPGNPQGRHANEAGPRGAYLVEISDAGAVALEFRPTDLVRWQSLELRIDDIEDEADLFDRLDQEVVAARDAADGRDLVMRLTLTGRGPVHGNLVRPGFMEDVQSQLNQSWASRRPFAYCERIADSTAPTVNRDERKQAEDFVGDLLRLVDDFGSDPGQLDDLQSALDPLFTNARAARYLREFVPTDEELTQLLNAAEGVSLDLLLKDDA